MWQKITPKLGRKNMNTPRINSNDRCAQLYLPKEYAAEHDRASIYYDGGTRIAFALGADGEYAVTSSSKNSMRRVMIPAELRDKVRKGIYDVTVKPEAGAYVLDTATL